MQLKIYAASRSISATIPDDYGAKGESLKTLIQFHNGESVLRGNLLSRYTFGFHFVFPVLAAIFAMFLAFSVIGNIELAKIRLIIDGKKDSSVEREDQTINEAQHSQLNMRIVITVICSYLFLLYVIILDCVAIASRTMVDKEIFHSPSRKLDESEPLRLEFGIPILLFVEDFIVSSTIVVIGFIKICRCKKLSWYFVLFGPAMCIVIHSYHILIGFIHSPHHASSVLVFYGLMVIFFIITLKTFYYTFSHWCAVIYKNNPEKSQDQKSDQPKDNSPPSTPVPSPQAIATSLELQSESPESQQPIVTVQSEETGKNTPTHPQDFAAQHKNDESQEPIHHQLAKKFFICCGCILKCQHQCKLSVLIAIAVILALLFVFLVYLFVLVPINNAIDDAPSRIVSINQTLGVIIGIFIAFKIFDRKTYKSFLDYLVKARTSQLESDQVKDIQENEKEALTEWKKKSNDSKREDVARIILKYYTKPEDSSEDQNS